MARLHELLAIEGQLKGQADKARGDLSQTFEKKRHLFSQKLVTFMPNREGAEPATEEQSELQSTVRGELGWLAGIWTPALDTSFAVALSNTIAKADIVLDNGKVLAKDVPATALLDLEKRATEMQELIARIPTLDPAKGFKVCPDRGDNIYQARESTTIRTQKVQEPLVLYPATDKHPAQVQVVSKDVPVGVVSALEWSGLPTPAEKAGMLERVEQFRRAVKSARARANQAEAPGGQKIGHDVLSYVFGI